MTDAPAFASPLHEHFDGLFRYDAWAHEALAKALAEALAEALAGRPDEEALAPALRLFAHVTRAAELWLGRVEGSPAAHLPVWPEDTDLAASAERGRRAAAAWRERLAASADLGVPVAYANSKGERFETPLGVIAAHVVNHGTHHRAQIARMLREANRVPPVLDLIAFARR